MIGEYGKSIEVLSTISKKTSSRLNAITLKSLQDLSKKQFAIPLYEITLEVLYFKGFFSSMQEKKLNAISKHIEQISSKAEYFLTTIFAIEAIVLKCLGQEKRSKRKI